MIDAHAFKSVAGGWISRHWNGLRAVPELWRARGGLGKSVVVGLAVAAACAACAAQASGQDCLRDADGDGHPMFAAPARIFGLPATPGTHASGEPTSASLGDVDGDGDLDAVIGNVRFDGQDNRYSRFSLLRNVGDGVFEQAESSAEIKHRLCLDVLLVDIDLDGALDLAMCDEFNSTVHVYLGDGSGGFVQVWGGQPGLVGTEPLSIAAGDIDSDGWPDLLTHNATGKSISLLRNTSAAGAISFAPVVNVPANPRQAPVFYPSPMPRIVCADINADGWTDVIYSGGGPRTLLNDGSGGLVKGATLPIVSFQSLALDAVDIDNDDDLDIVGSGYGKTGFAIWRNDGQGVFGAPEIHLFDWGPWFKSELHMTLATGDFDGNGFVDLASIDWISPMMTVLLNHGPGGMEQALRPMNDFGDAWLLRAGDLNSDGLIDAISVSNGPFYTQCVRSLLSMEHEPLATFLPNENAGVNYNIPNFLYHPTDVAVGDLNGDGDLDAVGGGRGSGQTWSGGVVVHMAEDGRYEGPGTVYKVPGVVWESSVERVHTVDLDGDGDLDIVAADVIHPGGWKIDGKMLALINAGDGTFSQPHVTPVLGSLPYNIRSADLDGDGQVEVVVWSQGVYTVEGKPRSGRSSSTSRAGRARWSRCSGFSSPTSTRGNRPAAVSNSRTSTTTGCWTSWRSREISTSTRPARWPGSSTTGPRSSRAGRSICRIDPGTSSWSMPTATGSRTC